MKVRERRFLKCRKFMEEESLAASIALSPENTLYFTDCYLMTQTDLRERLAMAVMPQDSEPVMIACETESASVEAETWIEDKRYYVEFQRSPIDLLAEVLKEKGLEGKRIGIETNYIMAHYYMELMRLMPNTEFVMCSRMFEKIRMVKDDDEIRLLRDSARSTIKAFEAACILTRPGETEAVLAKRTVDNLLALGADKLDFLCLSSGPRTKETHGTPGNFILEDGDILRIDFGGQYHHYLSDLARTVAIGKENPIYEDDFMRLREAYVNTYPMLRPGIAACEVHQTAKKNYEKAGIPFTCPLVGHGLGIGPHELPVLSSREKQVLMPNMILCYEMHLRIHDRRLHHEELVQITEHGPKILSAPKLDPQLMHIG